MARIVEASFCAYCTEWAWSFRASLDMGRIGSPTHTQEDYVESDLSALNSFAQFSVLLLLLQSSLCCMVRLLAGHQA
eukprot:1140958-Pelagomonas_calceolata.AAC.1